MQQTQPQVNLDIISTGTISGLTARKGASMAEAAAYCLNRQGHSSGVSMGVNGTWPTSILLNWNIPINADTRATYDDIQDSTEEGACGIAIITVLALTRFTKVTRSRKGTQCYYWLGDDSSQLFQGTVKLEVSGILNGDQKTIR